MRNYDEKYLRLSFDVAIEALNKGNHPFGAILVDENGEELLRAGNSIEDDNDTTAHAETNLIRLTWGKYDAETLAKCTLYSSAEPCDVQRRDLLERCRARRFRSEYRTTSRVN